MTQHTSLHHQTANSLALPSSELKTNNLTYVIIDNYTANVRDCHRTHTCFICKYFFKYVKNLYDVCVYLFRKLFGESISGDVLSLYRFETN